MWLRRSIVALSCLILAGLFSKEISNADFWWHLRSGEYLWQTHSLPDPDPFAYTTALSKPAYNGEEITRRFNLTHEWLAQVLLYLTYRLAGFAGIVLVRTALLGGFCALVSWIAYQRSRGFYRSLAAGFLAAAVAEPFTADRPFLVSFLFLAATVAILESKKKPWLFFLPVLMLAWANCHGGFFLGLLVMGLYSLDAVVGRVRGRPQPGDGSLWIACTTSALAAGWNPNGFRVLPVMLNYHRSFLTSTLQEWAPPFWWPPSAFSVVLVVAVVAVVWAYRRVRLVDWLLFVAFSAAAVTASRNTILVGFWGPILIATYWPWHRPLPRYLEYVAAALLFVAFGVVAAFGQGFRSGPAEWEYPVGAADFLRSHHITQPMFNTYEYGGYLMWRLWPQERVFIDGRALSENVFADYGRILYYAGDRDGQSAPQLLDRYGVQVIVMNTFEYTSGQAYVLAPALADPEQGGWSLVYADAQAVVFMRHPPPDVKVLDSAEVFNAMQSECAIHIQHQPQLPGCARNLAQWFEHAGDPSSARRWLGIYLEHAPAKDPAAEAELQRLVQPDP